MDNLNISFAPDKTAEDKGRINAVEDYLSLLTERIKFCFNGIDENIAQKSDGKEEKQLIARYAAALITKDDFVYLDAGTTTGCMIDFITEKSATYVTNAVSHAQKLAAAGFRVYLIGGELKPTTEAVVGNQAILSLETLHFSKAFFGTNGVSLKAGFSTPDYEEAMVKKTAIGQAKKAYILADYSKFGNISSVTFEEFAKAQIITDRKPPEAFLRSKNIIVA